MNSLTRFLPRRFFVSITALVALLLAGTLGYRWLEGMAPTDARSRCLSGRVEDNENSYS